MVTHKFKKYFVFILTICREWVILLFIASALMNRLFFDPSLSTDSSSYGGETASTGVQKHRLHTERLPARKKGGNLK